MHRPLLVIALPLIALAGCDKKPGFDESYAAQEAGLRASANSMEQDLSQRISASRDAARVMAEANAGNASLANTMSNGASR